MKKVLLFALVLFMGTLVFNSTTAQNNMMPNYDVSIDIDNDVGYDLSSIDYYPQTTIKTFPVNSINSDYYFAGRCIEVRNYMNFNRNNTLSLNYVNYNYKPTNNHNNRYFGYNNLLHSGVNDYYQLE